MKPIRLIAVVLVLSSVWLACQQAQATFHFMQIEQVIGGVNGDTSAQAIQLRMRFSGQQFVSQGRIRAWDAAGANPVIIIDMLTDVAVGLSGRRVLITSASFGDYTDPNTVSDFTMTNPIPASYLNAGKLSFETNNGNQVYWILSWGGANYSGTATTLRLENDADGIFSPPFDGVLPNTSLQALQFTEAATANSTNNDDDYAITAGASTWVNNPNNSFTLVDPPEPDSGDFDNDDEVNGEDFLTWQLNAGGPGDFEDGDANHDGDIDGDDLVIWEDQYNTPPPLVANLAAVPEPNAVALLLCGLLAISRHRQRCK